MKNRLYAFLITAILLILLGTSSYALSDSANPLTDLGSKASLSAELPSDTVIHFPDPNFEAAVRDLISKPEGDII